MKRDFKNMIELKECLKNPSPKLKVPVYTEDKDEDISVNKPTKKKITLNQRLDELTKIVTDGFKQVNSRIDKIDSRLDYIVKANKLKDLPKSK